MKEELILSVAGVLQEWNPLGERMSSISDLEGYRYEAIDIISSIKITKSPVMKSVSTVLTEAFGLELDQAQLIFYSSKIEALLN